MPVLVFDSLVHPAVLAMVSPDCELIYVGRSLEDWLSIRIPSKNTCRKVEGGKEVVRLKGGDPYIFGRGGEEALFSRKTELPLKWCPV